MRSPTRMLITVFLLMPLLSQAMTWSGCQTITAVSNYLAFSNAIYVSITPGISGCLGNAGTPAASAVGFAVGQENVTLTNISSFLAISLTAVSVGRQVTIYYDETTAPQCYAPQTYQAGALLENGARVAEIHADYVLLQKGTRSVRLYLETSPASVKSVGNAMTMVGRTSEPAPPAKSPSREVLTDYIRPSPVYDGNNLLGYQVYPGAKSGPFYRMGAPRTT